MTIDTRAADEVEIHRQLEWIGQDDAEWLSRRFTVCLQDWMDAEGYDVPLGDLRRRLRFLLEAVIRRERPQWRPIETAPFDRSLLVCVRFQQCDVAMQFHDGWYASGLTRVYPTHWMPLPDPPPEKGTP